MSKGFDYKKLIIFASIFVANYILLYVLSALNIFYDINKPWSNHLFIIAFFVFGYFLFNYLQKEIDFNFAEIYIGIILLILLYFGFFLAYWIYYSQLTGLFTYLFNSSYIHIAISIFSGYLTFFFINFKSK